MIQQNAIPIENRKIEQRCERNRKIIKKNKNKFTISTSIKIQMESSSYLFREIEILVQGKRNILRQSWIG